MPQQKTKKANPKTLRLYTYTELGYILNEFYWLMRNNANDPVKAYRYYDNLSKRRKFKPAVGSHTHSPIK